MTSGTLVPCENANITEVLETGSMMRRIRSSLPMDDMDTSRGGCADAGSGKRGWVDPLGFQQGSEHIQDVIDECVVVDVRVEHGQTDMLGQLVTQCGQERCVGGRVPKGLA